MRRGHGWLKRRPLNLTASNCGRTDWYWHLSKVIGALSTGSSTAKRRALIESCFCASDRDLKLSRVTLIPQIAYDCRHRGCLRTRKIFPRPLFFRPFRTQRRARQSKRAKPRTRHFSVNWVETKKWFWLSRSPGRGEPTKPKGSQTRLARKRHQILLCRDILFPQFARPSSCSSTIPPPPSICSAGRSSTISQSPIRSIFSTLPTSVAWPSESGDGRSAAGEFQKL